MKKDFSGLSIKSKLVIFSLCISLIPIAVITTIYYLNASSILKKHTLNDLTAIAEVKKRHILSFMDAKKERTMDFSSDGLIKNSLEIINQEGALSDGAVMALSRHLLMDKKPLDRSIVAIAVVDTNGKVVASSDERCVGMDFSGHESFTLDVGKDAGEAHISVSQPYFCRFYKTNCISVNVPITSAKTRGKVLGVLINCYDLVILSQITTNRTGMGDTEEVYLVNKNKVMLTDSRFTEDASLRQVVDTEPVRKIIEEGRGMTGIYLDYRGVPVVGASVYIPEYGWVLLAEIDKAEAFAPLKVLSFVALAVGLICAVTVTSVGIIFAFSTARPIYILKRATERFRAGDLKHRVEITRRDEIGDLAHSFNVMADEIALEAHKLSCAVEQSPSAIIVTDTKGSIEYVNPRFTQVTGYTFQEIMGKNPNILKSGKTSPEEYKRLWDTIISGGEWRGEFVNKKKNGDLYWASASISPVRDSAGVVTNFVGIQEDITERKQVEENLRWAMEQSDRNIKELRHLMLFSSIMNEEVQEGVLLNHMTRVLKEHFSLDILAVLMLDRDKNVLDTPLIVPSMPTKELIRDEVLLDPSLCRVIRTGQVLIAKEVNKESICECLLCKVGEGGSVCLPLIAGGITTGVVVMIKKEKGYWDREETIELLSTYVGLAASALHRVRLMEFARRASITDALTGAYNRRFFDEMMEKQIALAKRHNESLTLIIADIDHFKKLNDTYGHAIGDCTLQQVTRTMKNSIRSADILARYGGEEFVIIMPTTAMVNALEKAESLRQHIESIIFDNIVPGQSIKLTISIGVASFPEHGSESDVLVNAADSALYKAKKGGRNRVEMP